MERLFITTIMNIYNLIGCRLSFVPSIDRSQFARKNFGLSKLSRLKTPRTAPEIVTSIRRERRTVIELRNYIKYYGVKLRYVGIRVVANCPFAALRANRRQSRLSYTSPPVPRRPSRELHATRDPCALPRPTRATLCTCALCYTSEST